MYSHSSSIKYPSNQQNADNSAFKVFILTYSLQCISDLKLNGKYSEATKYHANSQRKTN